MARRTASPTPISGASGAGPSPVRSRSKVTDEIIESLRQDIVTDRLKSGERLPNERELAQYFGVSQPTIREALRALDVMGLIQVRHGSGAYVRGDSAYVAATALQTLVQLERVSIIEALDVRELLGRETARIAAGAADDADIEVIEQRLVALSELDPRATIDDVIERLAGFQIAVAAAAHSPLLSALEAFLINLLLQLQADAFRKRGAKRWIERSRGFHNDRRKIVDAIREHDGQRAFEAMENYLEHQRRTFMADPQLSAMRLSDPKAMVVAADLVSGARGL
jgi:GntR family transcriptional regulator, transcriptional repressor for pyruvate dehydrogenase complex